MTVPTHDPAKASAGDCEGQALVDRPGLSGMPDQRRLRLFMRSRVIAERHQVTATVSPQPLIIYVTPASERITDHPAIEAG